MENKEIQFLKERSRDFWDNAERLLQEGKYNLGVFNLEQACQLWLKYLIAKKIGEWPKTHYLEDLVNEFAKVYDNKKILKYYQEKELFFENLSDAYFTTRYYPRTLSQNLARELMRGSEEFLRLTTEITGDNFFER